MNAIPQRNEWLIAWFRRYGRWYVRRHFHGVRVSRRGRAPLVPTGPLIVVANHPSWWDPLVCMALTELFPHRVPYAPIDARALEQYRFFAKLGFFGVEPNSARGARTFLRVGADILGAPGTALWVTAQGRFTDARERPVRLMPGVERLAAQFGHGQGVIVPVAIEYVFWTENRPEALARFGEPVPFGEPVGPALERTQDALAEEAMSRDSSWFEDVWAGQVGMGGVYDLWRSARAWLRGKKFSAEHGALARKEARS